MESSNSTYQQAFVPKCQNPVSSKDHPFGRDISNLAKSYNDELKYSGNPDDNFDDKCDIFMEMCNRFEIRTDGLIFAFPTMLKDIAISFYFNRCRGKSLSDLCQAMRENFEGPEY